MDAFTLTDAARPVGQLSRNNNSDDFVHNFSCDLVFKLIFKYEKPQISDIESVDYNKRRMRQYEKCVLTMIVSHFRSLFDEFPSDGIFRDSCPVNALGMSLLNKNLHLGVSVTSATACVLPAHKYFRSIVVPDDKRETFVQIAREYSIRLKLAGTAQFIVEPSGLTNWTHLYMDVPPFFNGSNFNDTKSCWISTVKPDLSSRDSRQKPAEVVSCNYGLFDARPTLLGM